MNQQSRDLMDPLVQEAPQMWLRFSRKRWTRLPYVVDHLELHISRKGHVLGEPGFLGLERCSRIQSPDNERKGHPEELVGWANGATCNNEIAEKQP